RRGYLMAAVGMTILTACQISTNTLENNATELTIQDGRLRFSNTQAFYDTIVRLNATPPEDLTADYFASRFPGFISLAMLEPMARPNIPITATTMMVILDGDGTYQIDDRIFALRTEGEYVIPYSEHELVTKLTKGESLQSYVAA